MQDTLDARPADAAGRAALRPLVELQPGRAQRHHAHVAAQPDADHVRRRPTSVDAFNDITPRFGVAYDVFGNGKTALKFNLGHYLVSATNDGRYTTQQPGEPRRQHGDPRLDGHATATRSWTATC